MFRRNRERITQRLSGSVYSLTSPGSKPIYPWVCGAALVVAGVVAGMVWLAPPPALAAHAELERARQEVERLQHEIKLGELRLQQEVMTREELVRQMDTQSQKLRQAEQDLQFFRGQKEKPARERATPAP